jgi:hypothetical protein
MKINKKRLRQEAQSYIDRTTSLAIDSPQRKIKEDIFIAGATYQASLSTSEDKGISDKLKQLMVEWLVKEGSYPQEEAHAQIDLATITKQEAYIIDYDNGVRDIISINDNQIEHLNPNIN